MRYPNLRYGNPEALRFHAGFSTAAELAKRLRRSERTVRSWLAGTAKVPWWVPEIIRLQNMEHAERMRQMNMKPPRHPLAIVSGSVLAFHRPEPVTQAPDAPPATAQARAG